MERENPSAARPQEGSALVVALFISVIVAGLCTTLLLNSSAETQISANERDSERALAASKAGLSYGYHILVNDQITPTPEGTPFDSFDPEVSEVLQDAQFTGTIAIDGDGLYRITVTGNYRRASRTKELVLQLTPDIYRYGIVGFNDVLLHVHATHAHGPAEIATTVFANNWVEVGMPIDFEGAIVSSGGVQIFDSPLAPTTVDGDLFAYEVVNDGEISGEIRFLTSLRPVVGSPDVTDVLGNDYEWYLGRSSPDSSPSGGGSVGEGISQYVVQDGDRLDFSIFRPDGTLDPDPGINAIRPVLPPKIDYRAMKAAADENDPTYFLPNEALAYFAARKVVETVGGQTVTTIKVGSSLAPEFLYVRGDLLLTLDPDAAADDLAGGVLKADGLHIEGGIYTTGDFAFTGQVFSSPDRHPEGYNQLSINALPYCYPAIIAYSEPPAGTIDSWTIDDTPPIMSENQSEIRIRSDIASPFPRYQGPVYLNGIVFAESESHLHHSESSKDVIKVNGGQLAFRVHNCDYYEFQYDPAVRCTRFLAAAGGSGTATIVSQREIR